MKVSIPGILIDVVLFGSAGAWMLQGNQGARNIFVFASYCFAILTLIAVFALKNQDYSKLRRGSLAQLYSNLRRAAVAIICVYNGLFLLATVWIIAWAFIAGAIQKANQQGKPA